MKDRKVLRTFESSGSGRKIPRAVWFYRARASRDPHWRVLWRDLRTSSAKQSFSGTRSALPAPKRRPGRWGLPTCRFQPLPVPDLWERPAGSRIDIEIPARIECTIPRPDAPAVWESQSVSVLYRQRRD